MNESPCSPIAFSVFLRIHSFSDLSAIAAIPGGHLPEKERDQPPLGFPGTAWHVEPVLNVARPAPWSRSARTARVIPPARCCSRSSAGRSGWADRTGLTGLGWADREPPGLRGPDQGHARAVTAVRPRPSAALLRDDGHAGRQPLGPADREELVPARAPGMTTSGHVESIVPAERTLLLRPSSGLDIVNEKQFPDCRPPPFLIVHLQVSPDAQARRHVTHHGPRTAEHGKPGTPGGPVTMSLNSSQELLATVSSSSLMKASQEAVIASRKAFETPSKDGRTAMAA